MTQATQRQPEVLFHHHYHHHCKGYFLKKLGKSNSVAEACGLGNPVSASMPMSKQPPLSVSKNISKSIIRFKRTLNRSDDKNELGNYVESKRDYSRNDTGTTRSPESFDTGTTTSKSCSSK